MLPRMRTLIDGGPTSDGVIPATLARDVRVVGVAGHRSFADAAAGAFVERACRRVLARLAETAPDCVALSPLAEGADTAFAEAALDAGLTLEVVRPYRGFGDDFATAAARARYRRLLRAARGRHELAFGYACEDAFEAAMNHVVDGCDLLVVAWDGGPPAGRGGTAHAVRRAVALDRTWLHLDTRARTQHLHRGRRAGGCR